MSRMSRSAHGLTLDRDDDWRVHGLCRDDPDLWTAPAMSDIYRAMHICGHCPVRVQCRFDAEDAARHRTGAVYGGVYFSRRGVVSQLPKPARIIRCGWCVRGR